MSVAYIADNNVLYYAFNYSTLLGTRPPRVRVFVDHQKTVENTFVRQQMANE